jgi:thiamine pyrophosphokinase
MDNNDNKILIVTGGKIEDAFLLEYTKKERYAKIIAVDRGLIAIDRLQLSVDFIVGDFDSVSKDILDK